MLLDEASLSRERLFQSAAAPLLAGKHTTPLTLASNYWIHFSISQFGFKSFQDLAPKDSQT